jgi:hypothetical protein
MQWRSRGLLRGVIAAAVIVSFVPAAVAVAHSGPGRSNGRGGGFGRHHPRYYRASGWVVPSANATTLTVEDSQGRTQSFAVTTSTKYTYADGSSATAADASPYHVADVTGTAPTTSGGNPVATRVVIQLADVDGIVKSDTSGTLTVIDAEGFTRQISTRLGDVHAAPHHRQLRQHRRRQHRRRAGQDRRGRDHARRNARSGLAGELLS